MTSEADLRSLVVQALRVLARTRTYLNLIEAVWGVGYRLSLHVTE